MGKHISKTLEWDEVIPMSTAAYNFSHTLPVEKDHFSHVWQGPTDRIIETIRQKHQVLR